MKIFASKLKLTYVLLLILVSIVSISLAVDFYLPPESLDSKDLSLSISKSLEGESFVDKNYITGDDGEHIYFVETEEELLPNPINSSTADDQDVGAVSWPTSSIADNSLTPIRYSEKPSFFEEDLDVGDNAESFTNQNESPSRINREIRAINPRIYTYSWPRCILESLNWMDEDEYSDREQMYDRKKKLNEKIMAQIRSEYPGMPKKALILAGGFGTRCKPFTNHMPKPLLPFAGAPMILHMIRALAKHGVDTIIISLHYLGDQIRKVLNKEAVILKIKIIFVVEEKPLGTAGALRQAKAELESVGDGPFFMLNADIIAEYPFAELAKIHHESKGEHKWKGTIVATKVADPSKFGVIIRDDDGRIRGFVEKPKEYISDLINAGLYILEMEVVDMIPKDAEFSIERQVFPIIASEGYLNSIELRGFWKDLGNPRDFIIGQRLYLEHLRKTGIQVHSWIKGVKIIQPVLISITATINSGSIIGPNVVIGENVRIGFSVSIRDSSVMDGAYIGSKSHIFNSIVGWKAKVGREAYSDECYLGFGTEIKSKEVCRGRSVE